MLKTKGDAMNRLKTFLTKTNKQTILFMIALIAVVSAMLFGGINILSQGDKGAIIDTPEISTQIDSSVNAAEISGNLSYGPTYTVQVNRYGKLVPGGSSSAYTVNATNYSYSYKSGRCDFRPIYGKWNYRCRCIDGKKKVCWYRSKS